MSRLQFLREKVPYDLEDAYRRQAAQYNKHRRVVQFQVGDKVLKRQRILLSVTRFIAVTRYQATRYHGPYTISRILSPVVFQLEDEGGNRVSKISIDDLKPYYPPLTSPDKYNGHRVDPEDH